MKKYLLLFGILLGTFACLSAQQAVTAIQLAGYDNGTIVPMTTIESNPTFTTTDQTLTISEMKISYMQNGVMVENSFPGSTIPGNTLTAIRSLAEPVKFYGELKFVSSNGQTFWGPFSFAKQN